MVGADGGSWAKSGGEEGKSMIMSSLLGDIAGEDGVGRVEARKS